MAMKKITPIVVIIGIILLPMISSASIIYLGLGEGNDKYDEVVTTINNSPYFTGSKPVDISFYSKIDYPAGETEKLSLTYATDLKSGKWSTKEPIDFFTVKGANNFTVWWVNPSVSSGTWTTEWLTAGGGNGNKSAQQPAISHLSAWTMKSVSIPEPSTMLLLGFGLLGIAFFRRQRIFK